MAYTLPDRGARILGDNDDSAARLRRERASLAPGDVDALARLYAPGALGSVLGRCGQFMARAADVRAGSVAIAAAARPYADSPARRDVVARYLFVAAWPHRFHAAAHREADVLARLLLPNIAAGAWCPDAAPGPGARRRWVRADRREAIVRAAGMIAADGAHRCRRCGASLAADHRRGYCAAHVPDAFAPRDDDALQVVFDEARAGIEQAGAAWRARWARAGWPLGEPLPDEPARRRAA